MNRGSSGNAFAELERNFNGRWTRLQAG